MDISQNILLSKKTVLVFCFTLPCGGKEYGPLTDAGLMMLVMVINTFIPA